MASDNHRLETRNKRQTGEECVPIFRGHAGGHRGHDDDLSEVRNLNCERKLTKYQVLVQLKKNKTTKDQ